MPSAPHVLFRALISSCKLDVKSRRTKLSPGWHDFTTSSSPATQGTNQHHITSLGSTPGIRDFSLLKTLGIWTIPTIFSILSQSNPPLKIFFLHPYPPTQGSSSQKPITMPLVVPGINSKDSSSSSSDWQSKLLGKTLGSSNNETSFAKQDLPKNHRVVEENSMLTMDHVADRYVFFKCYMLNVV